MSVKNNDVIELTHQHCGPKGTFRPKTRLVVGGNVVDVKEANALIAGNYARPVGVAEELFGDGDNAPPARRPRKKKTAHKKPGEENDAATGSESDGATQDDPLSRIQQRSNNAES